MTVMRRPRLTIALIAWLLPGFVFAEPADTLRQWADYLDERQAAVDKLTLRVEQLEAAPQSHKLPPGRVVLTQETGPIVLRECDSLEGSGFFQTTITQADGANLPALIVTGETPEARRNDARWKHQGAPWAARVYNIGIDGNKKKNARGQGINAFGRDVKIEQVRIWDTPEEPIYAAQGNQPWGAHRGDPDPADNFVYHQIVDVGIHRCDKPLTIAAGNADGTLRDVRIAHPTTVGLLMDGSAWHDVSVHVYGGDGQGVVVNQPNFFAFLEVETLGGEGAIFTTHSAGSTVATLRAFRCATKTGAAQVVLNAPVQIGGGLVDVVDGGKPAFQLTPWARDNVARPTLHLRRPGQSPRLLGAGDWK